MNKKNLPTKRVSYKSMTSQGENPLLTYILPITKPTKNVGKDNDFEGDDKK